MPEWIEYAKLIASLEKPRRNFDIIGSNRALQASRELQDELGGEYWHYTAANRMGPQVRYAYGFKPYIVASEAALVWANYKGKLDGHGWTLHYVMPNNPDGKEARNTRGPVLASPRAVCARSDL